MKFLSFNEQKSMEDKLIAWHAGLVGGIAQYVSNVGLPITIVSKQVEGIITAILCGFGGLLGKELFVITKKSVKEYFKKRKENKLKNKQNEQL